MHLFEYYFEGTKTGDWMMMYQVIAKNRTDAEELINKISEPGTHDVAALKTMRCTVKLIPEYLFQHNAEEALFKESENRKEVKVSAGEVKPTPEIKKENPKIKV